MRTPPRRVTAIGLAALLLWMPDAAVAGSARTVETRPAETLPAETLHDAIASAWARLPQRALFEARANLAAARHDSGSAFFPDAPFADGEYDDDRLGSNDNYRTTRLELGTPLWLPGEGTATERAASAQGSAAVAESAAAHLAVAAQVLALALRAQLAADDRAVAMRRLASDAALARSAAQRFHVGEGSESDSLAADAARSGDVVSLSDAEATLGAAVVALATATGVEDIPRLQAGPAGASLGVAMTAASIERHPRIVAARQAVAAAEAKARLVRLQDRADPDIGLQVTNDKQPGSPWDTRAGLVLHVPFASAARNAPRRAQAAEAVTSAEVQLALARRAVASALREAAIGEAAAERSSAAAGRAAAALSRRGREIRQAWQLGEMPLIELVRAEAAAFDAQLSRDRALTQRDAARLRLVLAAGQIP